MFCARKKWSRSALRPYTSGPISGTVAIIRTFFNISRRNTAPIMQLDIEYGTAVVHSEVQYKPHPFPFYKRT